jgi:hypothetical protein
MFNAAVGVAGFSISETYLSLHETERPIYSDSYFVDDDVLGTAPIKKNTGGFEHGKLIYDVTDTIDEKELRIAPPVQAVGPDGSVLFFGCSFTFGEGVRDREALPYSGGRAVGWTLPNL